MKYKEIIELAVQVVLSRSGDIGTEDGEFALVDTDLIIRLETAISKEFELSSDDINESDVPNIVNQLSGIKLINLTAI